MKQQLQAIQQELIALKLKYFGKFYEYVQSDIAFEFQRETNKILKALVDIEKHECETCANKRKRLMEAGFLKSPLRGEDHVD